MKQARAAASILTAGGLIAWLVSALFGPPATPPAAPPAVQAPAAVTPAPVPATAAPLPAPAPAQPAVTLDAVRALRRAGLNDAAVAELRKWIVQNPKEDVPADLALLLYETDNALLDLARTYKQAALPDAARTALQQWMQQHPKGTIPTELRDLLPGPVDNSLDLARGYKAARLHDAASTELQKWIQKHPGELVPNDLEDLLPVGPDAFHWDVRHRLMPWAIAIAEVVALIALIGLLAYRFLGLDRPYLVIGDFDGGAISNVALGKALSASLRQQLAEPRVARSSSNTTTGPRAASRLSLSIATGTVEPVAIPAEVTTGLASTIPLAQVVGTIMRWASPWRVVTVTGILHAPGVKGAGLTLMAGEDSSVTIGVTIWQADFEPGFTPLPANADAATTARLYDDLVPPAATWLRFYMEDKYGPRNRSALSGDWRSRALFDAGIHMTELGRPDAAKTMYLRALGWDPNNDAARLNLALMLQSAQNHQIDQLEHVVASSKGRRDDVTYYSAAFSLVTALVDASRRGEAILVADELVSRVDRTLATLQAERGRQRGRPSVNDHLERYLRVVAPSARVIAAGLSNRDLPASVDPLWPSVEFQYNLACYFSMRGAGSLTRSIEHLEFAASLDAARVARYARDDRANVLSNVATDASTQTRFDAIVPPTPAPVTPPSALAQLTVIGDAHAAALATNGVASPSDLVVRCSTVAGTRALAAALGVGAASLVRWARAAELLRLSGMQPGHVNALTLAGLDAVGALRGLSSATIAAALKDFGGQTPAPATATIDAWALDVAGTPSLVVGPF